MKAVLQARGVPTTKSVTIREGDAAEHPFEFPVFVKPARAGSSLGVTRVTDPAELGTAVKNAFAEDPKVLIEEGLDGWVTVHLDGPANTTWEVDADAVLCQLEVPDAAVESAWEQAAGLFCLNAAPARPVAAGRLPALSPDGDCRPRR